jgi:hypothetical protein
VSVVAGSTGDRWAFFSASRRFGIDSFLSLPSDVPDQPSVSECRVWAEAGKAGLEPRKFFCLSNSPFEDLLQSAGARIETVSKTLSHETGTSSIGLQEIIFKLDSVRCFAYRIEVSDADACRDYVWISDHRLTASAAIITLSIAQSLAMDGQTGM